MHPWLAQRTELFDSSGIRKVFDLAAKLENPINLSIGQPDFPAPQEVKQAAIDAINADKNGYSLTQGIPPLREALEQQVREDLGQPDRRLIVTSGTSGALALALLAMVDPGDEVIGFDPYFVMYPALTGMAGGVFVPIDTYPDFRLDLAKVEAAITDRTKLILLNSPSNPSGVVATEDEVRGLAELAAKHNVALLSDEIYRPFCYDAPLASPARFNDQTLVVDAFSKSHALTGWRVGWAHGPAEVIEKMTMLQQYTFVCAPHPLQWGALAAMDVSIQPYADKYRERRDHLVAGLRDAGYTVPQPGGAFYAFPKVPAKYASATEFVAQAIERELLIIPGNIFSAHDSHFRISYAAGMETIDRGLEVLRELA
ncbi:putative N-acetyl-LL-diaminopimelate aminotransferase [Posidoniimonas corsicana]|uniref:Putative N-acetyl-LL-diaminopimelate aminotransferase n=1 Tax=Posidoniimonas corsicana TaxID=1938618 RepID=A0A5C5V7U8_9BACT|nr:aminotransferase class I/II-fold pyridoxal phosphate-dependent enzyme [Posidoniimonas corsicana]TWT33832.1 putative N-acetyl-LL-diaminopimelate aminotransferase [Posidoniimonas corsicana]